MFVVVRGSKDKDVVKLAAPLRVQATGGLTSGAFRVVRDCVPESRVPGLCLLLWAATPTAAHQWVADLTRLCSAAALSLVPPSVVGVGAATSAGASAGGSGGSAPEPVSPQPQQPPPVPPRKLVHVIDGSTWARLGDVDVGLFPTVAGVLDLVVNRVLKDIPTSYALCYSQPTAAGFLRGAAVVKDRGDAALARFAGEVLYIVPRETSTRADTFAEWVDVLARPGSAVAALRRWQTLAPAAQRDGLLAVDRAVAQLRTDNVRRLLLTYPDTVRYPALRVDRYRFHDVDDALLLSVTPSPREETLAVANTADTPLLVCVAVPVAEGVVTTATPEVFRVEPHETQTVVLQFLVLGARAIDDSTHFVHIFAAALAPARDAARKQIAVLPPDVYLSPFTTQGSGSSSAAGSAWGDFSDGPSGGGSFFGSSGNGRSNSSGFGNGNGSSSGNGNNTSNSGSNSSSTDHHSSSPTNGEYVLVEASPVSIPVAFARAATVPGETPCTVQCVASAAALGSVQNTADDVVSGLGACKHVVAGRRLMLLHSVVLDSEQYAAESAALQGLVHPALLVPSIVLRPEAASRTRVPTELFYNCPAVKSDVLHAVVDQDPRFDSLELRLKVALDVAQALAVAHRFGLAHSAVKPENVLIVSFAHGSLRANNEFSLSVGSGAGGTGTSTTGTSSSGIAGIGGTTGTTGMVGTMGTSGTSSYGGTGNNSSSNTTTAAATEGEVENGVNAVLVGSWLGALQRQRRDAGTRYFAAPEVSGELEGTPESDVFSFGMLLYTLVARTLPFADEPEDVYNAVAEMDARIQRGLRPALTGADAARLGRLPPRARALIAACWRAAPAQRPPMALVARELALVLSLVADARTPALCALPPLAAAPNTSRVPRAPNRSGVGITRSAVLRASQRRSRLFSGSSSSAGCLPVDALGTGVGAGISTNSSSALPAPNSFSELPQAQQQQPVTDDENGDRRNVSVSPDEFQRGTTTGGIGGTDEADSAGTSVAAGTTTSAAAAAGTTTGIATRQSPQGCGATVVVAVMVPKEQKQIKLRIAREGASVGAVCALACKYLREDAARVQLSDAASGIVLDDETLRALIAAAPGDDAPVALLLAPVTRMLEVVFRLHGGDDSSVAAAAGSASSATASTAAASTATTTVATTGAPRVPETDSISIGNFLPSVTLRDMVRALHVRNIALVPPFVSTRNLVVVDARGIVVGSQDATLEEFAVQQQKQQQEQQQQQDQQQDQQQQQQQQRVVVFDAVPRTEVVHLAVSPRGINNSGNGNGNGNGNGSNNASEPYAMALHVSVPVRVVVAACAAHWGVDASQCSLLLSVQETRLAEDQPVGTVRSAPGAKVAALGTAAPGSPDAPVRVTFVHFVPVPLRFWRAPVQPGDAGTVVTVHDSLMVRDVLRQAAAALCCPTTAAPCVSSSSSIQVSQDSSNSKDNNCKANGNEGDKVVLAQHGTGTVLDIPGVSTEAYGTEFDLVPRRALVALPVAVASGRARTEEVVCVAQAHVQGAALLASPALQRCRAPVLVNEAAGVEVLPADVIDARAVAADTAARAWRLAVYAADDARLCAVHVAREHDPGPACTFRALRAASAQAVRERAAALLAVAAPDPVLADTDGCIIDDLCTMADLESFSLVLLD